MNSRNRVVVIGRMKDHQMVSKLKPLLSLDDIAEVLLVRRYPLYRDSNDKIKEYCPPRCIQGISFLSEVFRLLQVVWLAITKPAPLCVIGMQFMPHGVYASLFGFLARCPVVQLLVGEDLNKVVARKSFWRILSRARKIGVRGEQSRQALIKKGLHQEAVFIPPNVFDVGLFEEDSSVEKQYDLISVGELIERKQHDVLIRAVSMLRGTRPAFTMAIIGDGPLKNSLEALAVELGVENAVHFLGKVEYRIIGSYLNKARVFVLASRAEGLPMAMVEAMSCGVPVVVPDVNDVRTVARDGVNSIIVNPEAEAEDYAVQIGRLLEDDSLYRKLKHGALETRKVVQQRNTLKSVAEVWASVLGSFKP